MKDAARILYVIVNMELGGTEHQLCELTGGLDRNLFSPHLCCLRGGGPLAGALAERLVPVKEYQFPHLDYSRKLDSLRRLASQVLELSRFMRSLRPAIVHGFLPMAFVTAGLAAKLAGVPVIVTSRRGLGYYKEGRVLLRFLENSVNIWSDAVVANSEAVRRDTLSRERVDPKKLKVIYNGVAMPAGSRRPGIREVVGRDLGGPVVALVANFFPYKGHMDFIAAASIVVKSLPKTGFVLVGDGMLRGEIEKVIAMRGLSDNFILLGARRDSREVMGASDLVALTSHEEGFPNVVLEAMAAGKPVVATKVGGVPEAVVDGETGLLVPPRYPEELAKAIMRLLEDRRMADEMGRRGMERARDRFSIGSMVSSYEKLYLDLLARKGFFNRSHY